MNKKVGLLKVPTILTKKNMNKYNYNLRSTLKKLKSKESNLLKFAISNFLFSIFIFAVFFISFFKLNNVFAKDMDQNETLKQIQFQIINNPINLKAMKSKH